MELLGGSAIASVRLIAVATSTAVVLPATGTEHVASPRPRRCAEPAAKQPERSSSP